MNTRLETLTYTLSESAHIGEPRLTALLTARGEREIRVEIGAAAVAVRTAHVQRVKSVRRLTKLEAVQASKHVLHETVGEGSDCVNDDRLAVHGQLLDRQRARSDAPFF